MINFPTPSIIKWKNPYCFIKTSSNEFTTSWWKIDVENRCYMILMYHFCLLRLSHIKSITMWIFVTYDKVHWLLRIPTYSTRLIFQIYLVYGCISSNIIQTYAPVHTYACKNVYLRRIKFNFRDCIDAPFKSLQGSRSLIIPDLNDCASCGKMVSTIAMIQWLQPMSRDICGTR